MTATTATLRRSAFRAPAAAFFTLGPLHFLVLMAWLLLFALLYVILLTPWISNHLARLEVQAHQQAFGFRLGLVDNGEFTEWRIVEVTPGGRLDAAGFRAGDAPTSHHGYGIETLARVLDEARAGRTGCVTVWNAGFGARREVCVGGEP